MFFRFLTSHSFEQSQCQVFLLGDNFGVGQVDSSNVKILKIITWICGESHLVKNWKDDWPSTMLLLQAG